MATFDAIWYAIGRIKEVVPIWKREVWTDGYVWVGSQVVSSPLTSAACQNYPRHHGPCNGELPRIDALGSRGNMGKEKGRDLFSKRPRP